MLTGIVCPLIVPSVAAVHVPAVTATCPAPVPLIGAVQLAGTERVSCEPALKGPVLGAVKVNVKLLPVLPATALVGVTVIVPEPLAATVAVKVAVIELSVQVPEHAVNVQGLVVPEQAAVPVVLQLLKVYPEFAVAVTVTPVPPPQSPVQVPGQLMLFPVPVLTTFPLPLGVMVTPVTY
jgi:hypothetical protein